MAKIAVEPKQNQHGCGGDTKAGADLSSRRVAHRDAGFSLKRALTRRAVTGSRGEITSRSLASGDDWSVNDVLCTLGPQDRSSEERHSTFSIAFVIQGSFQYRAGLGGRSTATRELMMPGSLLLGNPGQSFECGHEHGTGDRCIAFHYSEAMFEDLASSAGDRSQRPVFQAIRVPPLRSLSPLVAGALAGLMYGRVVSWEELGIRLAVQTMKLVGDFSPRTGTTIPMAEERVTRVIRMMEHEPSADFTLQQLAKIARLSAYHFLRVFEQVTGLTPHQYVLRSRLRQAAVRLMDEPRKVLDIAFDCGFGDVSNFNRAFCSEFGVSPRQYRRQGPVLIS